MSVLSASNIRTLILRSQTESDFCFLPTAYGISYGPCKADSTTVSVAVFLADNFNVNIFPIKLISVMVTNSVKVKFSLSDEYICPQKQVVFSWQELQKPGGILKLKKDVQELQRQWTVLEAIDKKSLDPSESVYQFFTKFLSMGENQETETKIKIENKVSRQLIKVILSDNKPKSITDIMSCLDVKTQDQDQVLRFLKEMVRDGTIVQEKDMTNSSFWRLAHSKSVAAVDAEKIAQLPQVMQWFNNYKQTHVDAKISEKIKQRGERHALEFQVSLLVDEKTFESIWTTKLKYSRGLAVLQFKEYYENLNV